MLGVEVAISLGGPLVAPRQASAATPCVALNGSGLHIWALAQKERALISERTKAALRAAKAQGTVLGNPRLSEAAARGTAAGKSRADQFAANLLPLVREIQKAGASSLNAIADALNKRGIRTARGKEWTHVQVGLTLRRTT
jgi:DNA invertase Pin-like site-specific DNA recombinase